MNEPPLELQHPLGRLRVDLDAIPEAKDGPDPAAAEGRELLENTTDSLHQNLFELGLRRSL
jgi:hypothetical protein